MAQRHIFPKKMHNLVNYITEQGQLIDTDRGMTREIINANLVLMNIVDRLDTTRRRKMNIGFAFAEFVSLLSGNDRIEYFTKFIKNYDAFSSDGMKLDGAYGKRLMDSYGRSAIEDIIDLLKTNPLSRRAFLPIFTLTDLTKGTGGLNTPCTIGVHFLVRHGQLISIATMRSNDVYYGLTNDLVVFTLLQEYVANRIGKPAGPYYHNASSLHYYTAVHDKFAAPEDTGEARWPWLMQNMNGALNTVEARTALIDTFNLMSEDNTVEFREAFGRIPNQYSRNMAAAAAAFILRKRDVLAAKQFYNYINDKTLRRVTYQWIKPFTKDA